MWEIDLTLASRKQIKQFSRDHSAEYSSCFANLRRVVGRLNDGTSKGNFKYGFFRSEGGGLFRIGNTGVRSAKETRLYVYFQVVKGIVYVLGIGTKESQTRDIREHKATIRTRFQQKG